MKGMNRRRFLQIAGASSVAVAAGTAGAAPLLTSAPRLAANSKQGTFTFRAVTGLPTKYLPTYASYVLDGHVNLTTRSGVLTNTVFAGAPDAMSLIAIPGLSRIIRINEVQDLGGTFRLLDSPHLLSYTPLIQSENRTSIHSRQTDKQSCFGIVGSSS